MKTSKGRKIYLAPCVKLFKAKPWQGQSIIYHSPSL